MTWPVLRLLLPYPDVRRRRRVRSEAGKLVTCEPWPGDDAKGSDAAQLALRHLLYLQSETRRAVRWRHREAAALLARDAIETYIVGAYCLHSDDIVARLVAVDGKAARRAVAYLTETGLVSQAAIDDAAKSLPDPGPDLNLSELVTKLERDHSLKAPKLLYELYYRQLSHFFAHPSAYALMRHVGPDKMLRRRPQVPWSLRSAARLADTCTGLMAQAVAEASGRPADLFASYAEAHADRMVLPVVAAAVKDWRESAPWRRLPEALWALVAMRRYTHGGGAADSPAAREARVREGFAEVFATMGKGESAGLFQVGIDEAVSKIVAAMDDPPEDAGQEAAG